MKRTPISSLLALAGVGALLAACGGSTRTVSVANPPPSQPASSGSSSPSKTSTGTPATSIRPAATVPPATGSGSQNSSSGPAFLKTGGGAQGVTGALSVLHARGFAALDTSQYHPDQTLRVLIGARRGSADERTQQAFFFVDGHYIGTDTSQPSAGIHVTGQGDTQVTLAYALYRPQDPLCCPGGGQATVRYELDNGHLVALDPIPSASAHAALSRQ